MKLSEAIRIGLRLRPQCFGKVFKTVKGLGVCSCSVGAAYEALQGHTDPDSYHAGIKRIENRRILHVKVLCPDFRCNFETNYIVEAMEHLNDTHYWERERIADWVESIEKLDECLKW